MVAAIEKVLVTGATGYIGGRLVPRLLEQGYSVRCLARHPAHLEDRQWSGSEIVPGDALRPGDLENALRGMDAAYYLIHAVASHTADFPPLEAEAAHNFARAASKAGVRRVVFLGGMGGGAARLSRHLTSRHAVGEILRREGPPTTEFRAAIIVGSGSVPFEMIRHIVEQHPIIPRFRWLTTHCQPIAIRDVLSYLILALELDAAAGRTFEIGGRSIHTYEEMMRIYARRRGLTRLFVPSPNLPPRLCAAWIGMLTPIPSGFALPLIESLRHEMICRDDSALRVFPVLPLDYETALRYALLRLEKGEVETTWTMALLPQHRDFSPLSVVEGMICEERRTQISAPPAVVFAVFTGIGGKRGWFYADWLWKMRAAIDRALGGVGMRRGRRDPEVLRQGEPLEVWRVERIIEGRLLLLRAEMFVPGKAWLQFESMPSGPAGSTLRITAYYDPKGFWGRAYWHALHFHHKLILSGLARAIRERAEQRAAGACGLRADLPLD
jgi:uncharacterized protein YbjT (DUF2867 family)